MAANPRAGQPAQPEDLIDIAAVVTAYYSVVPDPDDVDQQVAFGTSGHRGSSLDAAFNEAHILATTQAIVEYRAAQGTTGPLFIGRDTHALSEPAWVSALEVLAANDVVTMIDSADRYTPTPAVSHAILSYNRGRDTALADGIVVTPSHNPPRDGGFKYNPPNGGPADTDATKVIAARANELLRDGLTGVKRIPLARALTTVQRHDYLEAYVADLPNVVDPVTASISEASNARMMPSLSVVHTEPSLRRNDAPALSSPPKPIDPPTSPSTNHLNPTGTSTSVRPNPATTRSMIDELTAVLPTAVPAPHSDRCVNR